VFRLVDAQRAGGCHEGKGDTVQQGHGAGIR
jgi:hypothetical protein